MKKGQFTTQTARDAALQRWRKKRGIKLVVSLMPYEEGSRATIFHEGATYIITGSDNRTALQKACRVMDKLITF